MMGFGFTLAPNTHNTDLITTAVTATAITVTRTNIDGSGGTGTIIGTTTIGTTTGIDVERYLLVEYSFPRGGIAANNAIGGPAICFDAIFDPPVFLCFLSLRRK